MALSLLSQTNYTELQNIFDPSRLSFDYQLSDQMELATAPAPIHNNLQVSQISQNTADYHDYEVINFVDSPPNSKDSWPNDYQKSESNTEGPVIIDVQTVYSLNSNRKRRMDWESLDINQGVDTLSQTNTKIPNLGNKEREKKKIAGRNSWTDDIDFDLNSEFGNNGYLNNDAFLSLSSELTVLKQEIPSPNSDERKVKRLPQQHTQQPPNSVNNASGQNNASKNLLNDDNGKKEQSANGKTANGLSIEDKTSANNAIGALKSNNIPQSKPSGDQIIEPQPTSLQPLNRSPSGVYTQQQPSQPPNLQQQKSISGGAGGGETNSARNSPSQSNIPDGNSEDFKFQYILAAATSIATKNNEETLTYLNQGQSYEIKLKKLGDLSQYRGKILKSIIKICFHERRLQYMEREQMQQWQASRPGDRIIEVDVPLSYGLCHVSQPLNPNLLNTVEVLWDPMKEVGVYIKVNCISTEFTPKKHGGEKGVPFRIQIETYLDNTNVDNLFKPIHAAACQIKVFKLKGADRKHKQDREKIQKRPPSEQEKYQPSYECTILNDISTDAIGQQGCYSPEYIKPTVSPLMPNSPVHMPKYDGVLPFSNTNSSPIAINSVTSTNTNNFKLMDQNMVSPQQPDIEEFSTTITKDSSPCQVSQWLTFYRLTAYVSTFTHFSGSDILRMSKEDLIQICGLADGIRMFNTLHAKAITPRLTIYVSIDGSSYHAIYLTSNTTRELAKKLIKLPGFYELCSSSNVNMNGNVDGNVYSGWGMHSKYSGSGSNLFDASKLNIYTNGPSGILVMVTDEVLNNVKDDSLFAIEVQNGKVLMKTNYKNES
ncbi:unnamed protein product [Hermetia illucens]|uniref:Grh/CP2 DB domain-containing protein n=2 Tax=Hermetia illucens TaxID=343691 RepID=A0A7R8UBZ2_HERIL|nr:transcription factor CP2 isoform X1 [Hermetia illucens]CAD7077968.1 unnamed protein product [Hermetia illucens]